MKTVFLVYHTDNWQSWSSHRVVGIGTTFNNAIKLAKQDKDAISDVKNNNGHVVIYEYQPNKIDSDKSIFCTSNDDDYKKLIGKEKED